MVGVTREPSWTSQSRMYISILLGFILPLIAGTSVGWPSPMLKKLTGLVDNPLGRVLTANEISWLTSAPILGIVVGSFVMGILAQRFGRKPLLVSVGIPYMILQLTMAFSKVIWLYYVGRFSDGFAFGGIATLLPVYICELAPPKVRGTLCASMTICINFGTLYTYCVAPNIPFFWFHIILLILPVSFIITFFLFALESPYFLIQSDPMRAEAILKTLRGYDDVSDELNNIKMGIKTTSNGTILDVFTTRGARRGLLISVGLGAFMAFSGGVVITIYTQYIFDKAGGNFSGEVETILIGAVQVIVTTVASTITDTFGRKPLLTISYIGVTISQTLLGLYFFLVDKGTDMSNFGWLPLLSLTIYVVTYSLGVGPLSQTVPGELFPLRIKSAAMSFTGTCAASAVFVTTFFFQSVRDSIGLGETFWLFAVAAACGAIFIIVFMVETKGKTLECIQAELNGTVLNDTRNALRGNVILRNI